MLTTFLALKYKIFKSNTLIFSFLLHHNDNNLQAPAAGKAPLSQGSEPEVSQKCVQPEWQVQAIPTVTPSCSADRLPG